MTDKETDNQRGKIPVSDREKEAIQTIADTQATLAKKLGLKADTPRDQISNFWEAKLASENGNYEMLLHRLQTAILIAVSRDKINQDQLEKVSRGTRAESLTFEQIQGLVSKLMQSIAVLRNFQGHQEEVAQIMAFPATKSQALIEAIEKGVEWEKERNQ